MRSDTAIVTGAAGGIGAGLVDKLTARGIRVLATDLDKTALKERAAQGDWPEDSVTLRTLDVTSAASWEETVANAVDEFGRLDLCFNVAGILLPGKVEDVAPEAVDLHIDVNTKGVIFGTRYAAAAMVDQGGGHIVNISSLAGIAPAPGLSLYAASKHAVRGFSISAALELREKGVYVTAICPDAVKTAMFDLQVEYPEAALTFSGSGPLTTDAVVDEICGHVLDKKPFELAVPRSRGWLAKLSNTFPDLALVMLPRVRKIGLANQAKRQATER